jgi:hypothetical protein
VCAEAKQADKNVCAAMATSLELPRAADNVLNIAFTSSILSVFAQFLASLREKRVWRVGSGCSFGEGPFRE